MQERALSTLAFLTTSAANLDIVVASNGIATLVPLLGAKLEATALAAAGVLRKLLTTSAGQVGHLILCQARKVPFVFLIFRRQACGLCTCADLEGVLFGCKSLLWLTCKAVVIPQKSFLIVSSVTSAALQVSDALTRSPSCLVLDGRWCVQHTQHAGLKIVCVHLSRMLSWRRTAWQFLAAS